MNSILEETKEGLSKESSKIYIEVWEDIVSIKDLLIALVICSFTTLGGYFLAPNDPPKPLFFGLSGAILGFVICSISIKPKRLFIEDKQEL